MRSRVTSGLPLVLLSVMVCGIGRAEGATAFGVRGGFNAIEKVEDFEQYEIFASFGLPWGWHASSGWAIATALEVNAGTLLGGGETAFIGSVGPSLSITKAGVPLMLEIGASPAVLSSGTLGRQDLGTQIQFISHVGIIVPLSRDLDVGYRFQHMSNAGIEQPNPGLEMHMFRLGYRL